MTVQIVCSWDPHDWLDSCVVGEEIYTSEACDLLSVVFLALWFVNFFLTLNFKASIIYRFFLLSVTYGIFTLWFRLKEMFVIKFSVSFDTDQVERTTSSHVVIEVFARQKTFLLTVFFSWHYIFNTFSPKDVLFTLFGFWNIFKMFYRFACKIK